MNVNFVINMIIKYLYLACFKTPAIELLSGLDKIMQGLPYLHSMRKTQTGQ